tara:strand:+ start:35 stop:598 length:564 start_codon:yes stop_codon:yes gene_type:complete
MNIYNFNYVDIIYIILLILFSISFGIKGATRSISYSLKIILSVSIPFIFFKRILNYVLETINSEYLNSLNSNNSVFLEIISFIVIFLSTYIVFSLVEKALSLKSPSQLEFKILDIIIGAIYGIFLFSIIFYFTYITFLKNHIEARNSIMKFNISIYENLMYKDNELEEDQENKSSKKNNKNDQNKLY